MTTARTATAATAAVPRPRLSADAIRKRDLAMIHLAVKQVGLSREDYEHVLRVKFSTTSAAGLDARQRADLLKHFELLGFKRKPPAKAGTRPQDGSDQSAMIRGLWLQLHGLGHVRDSSEAALAAYVKRQTRVAALQWLNVHQAASVIEALKGWVDRAQKAQKGPPS